MWENRCYYLGIPDEIPTNLANTNRVPSYKKIALAILKNDNSLKYIGMIPKTSKYYHMLKRIEISKRTKDNQLKLF